MLPLEKETIGDKTQPNFLALMTMEVTDPRDQLKSEVGAQDYLHEAGGGGKEPIRRDLHLPYWSLKSTFPRVDFF